MKYNIDLEQYAKEAYDKYMNDNGFQDLKDVETVQNLTFQRVLSLIMRLNSFKLHR